MNTLPTTKEQWFALAWRATLVLLPWQTRLILETPALNGFPWEQGTFALYVSWIPLIATIALAWEGLKKRAERLSLRAMVAVPVITLLLTTLFTRSWPASFLWWAHTVLLGLFIATLIVKEIKKQQVATWFILSLIPHTLLALAQFAAQHVWGSTLFGMAEQIAWQSGTSVVEYGEYRVLRAYGGFPHPNLFGGWLAMALLLLPDIIRRAKTTAIKFTWIGMGALFLYTLVLTFSRSAWIAAAFGLTFAFFQAFRRTENKRQREALFSAIALFSAALLIAGITQWDAIATRTLDPERLEVWSVSQRVTAIHDGFTAFKQHPILGWGQGAALIGIGASRTAPSPIPLEPPHTVPFVILLETGILGLAAVLALLWFVLRPLLTKHEWESALPLLAALAIIAASDHYLWTLWAGKCLLVLVLFLGSKTTEKEAS